MVSVVIKATALDAAYLGVLVPHMIRQARFPFEERLLVIDRPARFHGKYAGRERASDDVLDAVVRDLLDKGEIDRAVEADGSPDAREPVMRAYFGDAGPYVPTHAWSGGPIYPALFGMETARNDLLVQMDCDMFFYTDGESWVERGLELMRRDSSLWLIMTHPGPPAGPAGDSLIGRNRELATWDEPLRLWRFPSCSLRYFLCDRRVLRGRLVALLSERGCAPLEQCITAGMWRNGAARGALGDARSWDLHVHSHADPFPRWAPAMARAIVDGRAPEAQRGEYNLRLDQEHHHQAWRQLLTTEGYLEEAG